MCQDPVREYASHQIDRVLSGFDRPTDELVFGEIDDPFNTTPSHASIPYDSFADGLAIVGDTGVGKSTCIVNTAYQMAHDGLPFCYIDFKGGEILDLLRIIPEDRLSDVEVIGRLSHQTDQDNGFDPLELPSDKQSVDKEVLLSLIQHDPVGDKIERYFEYVVSEIAPQICESVSDLHEVFSTDLDEIAGNGELTVSRECSALLEEFVQSEPLDDDIAPLVRRFMQLEDDYELTNLVSVDDPVSMYKAIQQEKILLVNLGMYDREVQDIISQTLVSKLYEAVKYYSTFDGSVFSYGMFVDDTKHISNMNVFDRILSDQSVSIPLVFSFEHVEQMWYEDQLDLLVEYVSNWLFFRQNTRYDVDQIVSLLDVSLEDVEDITFFEAYGLLEAKYGQYSGSVSPYPPVEPIRGVDDIQSIIE